MARPKKDHAERLTEQLNMMMTLSGKLALAKMAQAEGKPLVTYARDILMAHLEESRGAVSPDQAKTRLPDAIYKAMEQTGKHVNGIAKVYNSQPSRPPHPQKMAEMLDDLEGLLNHFTGSWWKPLKYDAELFHGMRRIGANLSQMQDNYSRENMRLPDRLERIADLLTDTVNRLDKLQ